MTEYIIQRTSWYRGKGPSNSRLITASGMKCCLGFMCEQAGIDRIHLIGKTSPNELPYGIMPQFLQVLVDRSAFGLSNSKLASVAMTINDNASIDDTEREKRLIELFKPHNIELKFVD